MRVLIMVALLLASTARPSAAESWSVATGQDTASGNSICAVHNRGDLMALYVRTPPGERYWGISIARQTYPGKPLRLNVDGTSFSTALESFIGRQADELMAALKSGRSVSYEWMDWPSRKSHHGTASLSGFREAAEQCERELS